MNNRLEVEIPGLKMKNPLMPGSGTFGFGDTDRAKAVNLNQLGALVIKTTTPEKRVGNPDPKIALVPDGVLNSVGLTNPGVDVVVSEKLPKLRAQYPDLPMVGSIGGASIDDYLEVAEKLANSRMLNALELNISCPNIQAGGMSFGTDPKQVELITKKVKSVTNDLPVYVKLTPNVTNIVEIAKAAESACADGLSMINTVLGMHIDIETRKPVLGNKMGGFSGKAIKPIAIRMIYQVAHAVDLPIIGMGGVSTPDDVIEMFLAGASAVGIGAAHFQDAKIIPHIAEKLTQTMDKLGIKSLTDLRKEVKEAFKNEN